MSIEKENLSYNTTQITVDIHMEKMASLSLKRKKWYM